jgi:hypothetical protein
MNVAWADRYTYLDYIRYVNLQDLIDANHIVDTGASSDSNEASSCLLCSGSSSPNDAVRLNHGKWICGACFLKLQHTRYPSDAHRRAQADLSKALAEAFPIAGLAGRIASCKIGWGIAIVAGLIVSFAIPSLGLPPMAIAIAALWISVSSLNSEIARRRNEIDRAKAQWHKTNPAPVQPELRDFHDPQAELTERDKSIQDVFDYWPGYPPYWHFIRRLALERDGRCQITGCPSRTDLHIHHKQPLMRGGSHRLENLVTLCAFHHGLQPDIGHQQIWEEISTQFFSLVCAHFRAGAPVRAHVRRRSVIAQSEILQILKFHCVQCPECNSDRLGLAVNDYSNKILIGCNDCSVQWSFEQKLTEETGPQVCKTLKPTKNIFSWDIDWEATDGIRKPIGRRKTRKSDPNARDIQQRVCPLCGSPLKIRDGRHGKFWSCASYPRCKYARDHEENEGRQRRPWTE